MPPPAPPMAAEELSARIRELQSKLEESEARAATAESKLALLKNRASKPQASPAMLYDREQVGFTYRNESIQPLRAVELSAEESNEVVETPLIAGGEVIGDIKITPSNQQPWTAEEARLTNNVAQRVALQIQNLRLLAATERARTEAQAATRQFTHESWEGFLDGIRNSERIGYKYDQAAVEPYAESKPAEHDIQETVNVLDEHIGNLYVKADPSQPLNEDDRRMVSAIAQRVAQQVENLRLLADASRARADAEEATRRLSRESWQAYTQRSNSALGYIYDTVQVKPLTDNTPLGNVNFIQPLTVRGEAIGRIAMADAQVTPEGEELTAQIAARVSEQLERLRLTEEIEKRAAELATVAAVSSTASTTLNPDELLQQVVDLTKERFNLYHAHIYLADESWNTLLLAAGAGDVGHQMATSGHAIQMDHKSSIVARAARERASIVSNDVRTEKDYLPHPLLPDTRSEMAVPMIVGDKVLGVLDVQADVTNRFTDEDVNVKTTLATQVAIALQNARLYAEQSATLAQLRELDRLKSSFLANMSHELRTPLNSILGFSDVILEELDGPLTPNMTNDLKLIQKNGQHLLHLINDVLDMAKIESGKLNLIIEKFNLHDIIEEVTSITSPLASEKDLALFIEPDSDREVFISADRTRLRQVLINLVNNAMKFTETGKISIRAVCEKANVLIAVKDTGIGIPPTHLEDVFQEFTQVDSTTTRKVGGTGLGLPISRRLIQMHGGRLWAESAGVDGEGATFYIFMPIEANVEESEPVTKAK
ncbi:MAG: ATP-binding protein [Anaerolineales bacterium]|nr:ATP-binding protein [Anaerolineales bacterium]